MASISKRNDEYRVRWRDPDGTERSRQCPNLASAKRLKKEIEECIAEGRRWEPDAARQEPDLEEILKAYAREVARTFRPTTSIRYARALDVFVRYLRKKHGARACLTPNLLTRNLLSEWYEELAGNGRHGRPRSLATRRKMVNIVQLAWKYAYDDDEYGKYMPRPRRIRMPAGDGIPTIAPTWREMDASIAVSRGWQRQLAIVLRFTGLRVQQAMGLLKSDFDFDRGTLRIRGTLGKSIQERRGRIIPVSQHLLVLIRTWEPSEDGWLIISNRYRGGDRERAARARDAARAWKRAGVRADAWIRQPFHAYRKGFISELKRAGADADAVEFLVGHSLGLRGVYTDPDALPLRDAVQLIPPLADREMGKQTELEGGAQNQ